MRHGVLESSISVALLVVFAYGDLWLCGYRVGMKGANTMRTRAVNTIAGESRLMDTEELRAYTNLGRNIAMKLGEEIGAKVKIEFPG